MLGKGEALSLDIIGDTINGIVCHKYYILNDIVLVQDLQGECKAYTLVSIKTKPEPYKINDDLVTQVKVANHGNMFLFQTNSKQYLVNEQNQIIEDSDTWEDSYFDQLSNSFYRKDAQGMWFDIEGFRLQEKVFIKGDVLCSLDTKKSKKSLSFKDQDIFISKHKQLIQVGKLLFNLNLEVVKYFGEKITGLGHINVAFKGEDVVQEVKLGLEDSVFINEFSHKPYLFNQSKIVKHGGTFQYGKKRVDVFETEHKAYGVEGSSNHFLEYNGKPIQIETHKHVSFKDSELIKVSDGEKSFYFDLNRNEAFDLPSFGDKNLSDIDAEFLRIGKTKVFNVSTPTEKFVLIEDDGSIFKLDDGAIKPERLEDAVALSKYYGFAIVDGQRKMFSKKQKSILRFGKDSLEVSEIIYNSADKIINAIDTNGNKLALDLRHGFEEVVLAESADGVKISEVYGNAMPIGNKTLINAYIETLGGSSRRVVDISQKVLNFFTLPIDLKEISDQSTPSVFAGNFISEIKFFDEQVINGNTFISADFMSFTGKEYPVILDKKSGWPLHLHGAGHRNELATSWEEYTLQKTFYLGGERMLAVKTLGEDQSENNLLFSIDQMTSWIPFYENYLPIFKHIVDLKEKAGEEHNNYHLFELREASKEKEYLAVEKIPPYRILVDNKSGVYRPRIVKAKKKGIRLTEELKGLLKYFYDDPGLLVEIE